MLDSTMAAQLQQYMGMLRRPFTITATLGDDASSADMRALLEQIASMSSHITLRLDGTDTRVPSFSLTRPDAPQHLRFAAIPLGHEFTSLVLALLWTGGHPPKVDAAVLEHIQALPVEADFEAYMSLSCHNCPDVVQALTLMAIYNPRIRATIIDGGLFQNEITARDIMGVPTVYRDGALFGSGRMTLEEILQKVDTASAARDAEKLNAKAPFEVLVIGAGPAGATAAIYAARKGIRTAIVAERFGGQVNDTLEIANYPGVPETQGPQYAAALEQHVRHYDVDIITAQRVAKLTAAAQAGGLATIELDNGATLRSRSVIIATGARWRNVGVPGEQEYKTKGVAYCPHCDGPLFKGKNVAVIGGGNSGVEAAIDLAGVVQHVTVLEYMPEMKADAVLVQKLQSLPNVTIHTNVQTTEITGDNGKVNGIRFRHRADNRDDAAALEGVFVQIGLTPSTDWLGDTVQRNRLGEIVTDERGATTATGIFAAGDCTNSPYKQIVVAAGNGATAALGAFDYLIRHPAA